MNKKLAIALTTALAVSTAGCSSMGNMFSGGSSSGETSYMSGTAPVPVDPAGTATFGTGSVSTTGAQDQRMIKGAGIGM